MSESRPLPISWPPSRYWSVHPFAVRLLDDVLIVHRETFGGWSSFAVRVGTPAQVVRVLISTAGQATWAVSKLGCPPEVPVSCSSTRGELFATDESSTWRERGNNSLGLELNLYPSDNATYGLETVALDFTNATGGPSLSNQVVAAISGNQYTIGMFGLGPQPTNLTNFTDPLPSFLTNLYDQNLIPSLSWSYTAGARYRESPPEPHGQSSIDSSSYRARLTGVGLKGVFGSLTLGGYDAARFRPSNVSFDLTTDISRDLVVGLQRITATESNGSTSSLLSSPHWTFIDSTIPYIYLPLAACRLFENVFGLTWNETYGMYLIDDELHQELSTRDPIITFEIANSLTGGPKVEIALPYLAFYLPYLPFFDTPSLRYFPIQRADNDTQLTLGRAFLQEAYVTAEYQHRNFSVSPCRFEEDTGQDIRPILPPGSRLSVDPEPSSTEPASNRNGRTLQLNREKLIGLLVGAMVGFFLLTVTAYLLLKNRRRRRRFKDAQLGPSPSSARVMQESLVSHNQSSSISAPLPAPSSPDIPAPDATAELRTNSTNSSKIELPGDAKPSELSHQLNVVIPSSGHNGNGPRALQQSPRRRHGMVFLTGGPLSTENIAKYWKDFTGFRDSRHSLTTSETTDVEQLRQTYLDRPLPVTPISESPQEPVHHAQFSVLARQHQQQEVDPYGVGFDVERFQHRPGFF